MLENIYAVSGPTGIVTGGSAGAGFVRGALVTQWCSVTTIAPNAKSDPARRGTFFIWSCCHPVVKDFRRFRYPAFARAEGRLKITG
jgi:hypothetical protein